MLFCCGLVYFNLKKISVIVSELDVETNKQLLPEQWYRQALAGGFVTDTAQQRAVEELQRSALLLAQGAGAAASVYLWGPVGRGKTWLMDNYFQRLQVPAKRQHFHHFMRWLHQRLHQVAGQPQPLQLIASELAAQIRVLCFDEVFVTDIADAILLGSVFEQLFAADVCLLMTSNQPPHQLYADGFNRERFLPAIAALERNMRVVAVDGGQDHRLHQVEQEQRYLVNQPQRLQQLFTQLSRGQVRHDSLLLGRRQLDCHAYSDNALLCDFAELCMQPWSAFDFIELCDRFELIFIAAVPSLQEADQVPAIARGTEDAAQQVRAGERRLMQISRMDDAVRRFIALIDECYDRKVPVYLAAEVAMDELYPAGALEFAFRRTLSRLKEMQRRDFAGN